MVTATVEAHHWTLGLADTVSPLFAPEASIAVAKLFPQREP